MEASRQPVELNGVLVGYAITGQATRNEDGTITLPLSVEMRKDLTEAELMQATGHGSKTTNDQLREAFYGAAGMKDPGL